MAQTIQILRTTTNTPPPTLLPGALSAELGPQTKLWIGAAAGNRLLLSTDPTDITLSGGAIIASAAPNAMPGSLWWDSNIGQLYIRYFDGNSTAWVSASTGTSVAIPIAVASGGTGAITAPAALTNLGALPVAGGTITGGLTVSSDLVCHANLSLSGAFSIGINGVPFATGDSLGVGFTKIQDNSGNITLYLGNNGAQPTNIYAQTQHQFTNRTVAATWALFDATSTKNVSGAWAVISDPAVKQDIAPYTRGLDAVLALEPVQFRYAAGSLFAEDDAPSRPLFGLMADQVKPHVPEIVGQTTGMVRGIETPLDTLEPGNLVYALINAVKELNAKVEALAPAPPAARR